MPSITITTDATHTARIATALGAYLGLGRDATAAEVKEWVITQIRGVVIQQERRAAEAALSNPSDLVAT